jgi:hypothetical protein
MMVESRIEKIERSWLVKARTEIRRADGYRPSSASSQSRSAMHAMRRFRRNNATF